MNEECGLMTMDVCVKERNKTEYFRVQFKECDFQLALKKSQNLTFEILTTTKLLFVF